ncbi:MAG: hypothetical protein V4792_05610 [Pseudomonadota bacterium]
MTEFDPLASAGVAAGNLHLSREACGRYLAGIESVALLDRDGQLLILPLTRESGGGLLLKVRNARGDRVIHAQEFFRNHGYRETFAPRHVPMHWDEAAAALVLTGLERDLKLHT